MNDAAITRMYWPILLSTDGITPALVSRVLSRMVADKSWESGRELSWAQGITRTAFLATLIHGEDALLRHVWKDLSVLLKEISPASAGGDWEELAQRLLNTLAKRIADKLRTYINVSNMASLDGFVSGAEKYQVHVPDFDTPQELPLLNAFLLKDKDCIIAIRDTYPAGDDVFDKLRQFFNTVENFFKSVLGNFKLPELDDIASGGMATPCGKVRLDIGKNAISINRTNDGDRLKISLKNVRVTIEKVKLSFKYKGEKFEVRVDVNNVGFTGSKLHIGITSDFEIEPFIKLPEEAGRPERMTLCQLLWRVVPASLQVNFAPDLELHGVVKAIRDILQALDATLFPGNVIPSEKELGQEIMEAVDKELKRNGTFEKIINKLIQNKSNDAFNLLPSKGSYALLMNIVHRSQPLGPQVAEVREYKFDLGNGYLDVIWKTNRAMPSFYIANALPPGNLFSKPAGLELVAVRVVNLETMIKQLVNPLVRSTGNTRDPGTLSPLDKVLVDFNRTSAPGVFEVVCSLDENEQGRRPEILFKCSLQLEHLGPHCDAADLLSWLERRWSADNEYHHALFRRLPFTGTTALVLNGEVQFGMASPNERERTAGLKKLLHPMFAIPLLYGRWDAIASPGFGETANQWLTLRSQF
ncbi:MAG TPA: hypothetical protein DCQ33_13270 [Nitrospira sp.]|nr:hypothetical protein [Nitrospira sp.]